MTDRELIEKLLATVERLDKAGTFKTFFEGVEEKNLRYEENTPCIDEENGYKDIRDTMHYRMAMCLMNIEENMGKAKFYMNYVGSLYDSYKGREKDITHPDILKFIKDYEEDNGLGGKE